MGDLTFLGQHQDMILSHEEGDPVKWLLILQTMSAYQTSDEVRIQLGLEIKPDIIVSYVKTQEEQEQVIRDNTPGASTALKREAYDISDNIEEWERLMTSVLSPNRVETMVNKYQKVWDEASAAAEVSFADDKLELMGGVKVVLIMANKLGFMMKQLSGGVEIVGGSVDDYFLSTDHRLEALKSDVGNVLEYTSGNRTGLSLWREMAKLKKEVKEQKKELAKNTAELTELKNEVNSVAREFNIMHDSVTRWSQNFNHQINNRSEKSHAAEVGEEHLV